MHRYAHALRAMHVFGSRNDIYYDSLKTDALYYIATSFLIPAMIECIIREYIYYGTLHSLRLYSIMCISKELLLF